MKSSAPKQCNRTQYTLRDRWHSSRVWRDYKELLGTLASTRCPVSTSDRLEPPSPPPFELQSRTKLVNVFFMTITAFKLGVRIDEQASSDSKDECKRLTERQFNGCLAQCSQCWTRTFSSPAYGTMLRNQYLPSRTISTHNEVFRMPGIEAHSCAVREILKSRRVALSRRCLGGHLESGTTEELGAAATPHRGLAFPGQNKKRARLLHRPNPPNWHEHDLTCIKVDFGTIVPLQAGGCGGC